MKKVALFLAEGFEEGESLETIDILRRCGIQCDSISIGSKTVTGSHGICVVADALISETDLNTYDMIVLPGGLPGAEYLKNDKTVIETIQQFNQQGKYIAAICAAPMALKQANITTGRTLTSYPSEKYAQLFQDANYITDKLVVIDGNLITSQGPATVFPFAYTLAEILGGNVEAVQNGMLYTKLVQSYK